MTRLEDDPLWWYDVDLSLSQSGDFVIINKTLIVARSITGESTKNSKENLTNLSRFDNWWYCIKYQVTECKIDNFDLYYDS